MAKLVALIERLEDLSHILMWSHMESERGGGGGSNPFASSGSGDSDVPLALLELPRLNLSFETKKLPDGSVRSYDAPVSGAQVALTCCFGDLGEPE